MAYKPGTVLTRKKAKTITVERPDVGEVEIDDPHNEVRVIGQSPISGNSGQRSEWEGQAGDLIVVAPLEFGENREVHTGQLDEEYDIVSIPEEKPHHRPEPPEQGLLPMSERERPEERFRREDKEAGRVSTGERQETQLAPSK